jgi:hypothetical protein
MGDTKESIGSQIIEALYGRYILKDFLAKSVPGFIVLTALAICMRFESYWPAVKTLNPWIWIPIYGCSWLAGFSMQGIGEQFGIIRFWPRECSANDGHKPTRDGWMQLTHEVRGRGSKDDIAVQQRLGLIKESCGNACVAVLCSLLLFWCKRVFAVCSGDHDGFVRIVLDGDVYWSSTLLVSFAGLLLSVGLWLAHNEHCKRHYQYMREVADSATRQPTVSKDAQNPPGASPE